MGKTLSYGAHKFPSSAGFTGSTGKVQSIGSYARSVPKLPKAPPMPKGAPKSAGKVPAGLGPLGSTQSVGAFARSSPPSPGAPPRKPKVNTGPPLPGGNALTQRSSPVTQNDAVAGGSNPLLPGFKKGGKVKWSKGGKC